MPNRGTVQLLYLFKLFQGLPQASVLDKGPVGDMPRHYP